MALLDEIVAEEGCVDHLYLDTRGNVTCGVGRLVSKPGELGMFTWSDHVAALKDWMVLQQMKRDCAYGLRWPATRYTPLVKARMLRPREGLVELLESIDKQLGKRLAWYSAIPTQHSEALIEMAYVLGVDGLVKGYPKMLAAVATGDVTTASNESHINGISDGRNRRIAKKLKWRPLSRA